MKNIKKIAFSTILLAMVATTTIPTNHAIAKTSNASADTEETFFNINADVESFTSTKLSWKKKNVSEYRIYEYSDETGKEKLLKTVSGKSTSCKITTKKGKIYNILVKGIVYGKNKKEIIKYSGTTSFSSDIAPLYFEDYDYAEAKTSPKSITLSLVYPSDGITPDGYEVYRSSYKNKSYKKIATVKKANYKTNKYGEITYTDKNVKFKKTYYYKIRGYKKINGKTYYSKYVGPNKHKAVNSIALLDVNKTINGDSITMAITSASGNDKFYLDITDIFNKENDSDSCYKLQSFEYNGVTWTSSIKKYRIYVDAGDTMYFTFTHATDDDTSNNKSTYSIDEMLYNGFLSSLDINIDKGTAELSQNKEAIH